MGASASKFGQYEANRGGLSPSVVELGAEASAIFFAIFFTAYLVAHWRNWLPKVFASRKFLYPKRTLPHETPPHRRHLFSWLVDSWSVGDKEILRYYGLDALLFLRSLRLQSLVILLCSLYGLCVILPVNMMGEAVFTSPPWGAAYTTAHMGPLASATPSSPADPDDPSPPPTPPLTPPSSTSTPEDATRLFLVHVVGAYYMTGVCLYMLWRQYQEYLALRHAFRQRPDPANYTIMVHHIPGAMRSNTAVSSYFHALFPNSVQKVTIMLELPELEALIYKREQVQNRLEWARVVQADRSKLRCAWGRSQASIDELVEELSEELPRLEAQVKEWQEELMDWHVRHERFSRRAPGGGVEGRLGEEEEKDEDEEEEEEEDEDVAELSMSASTTTSGADEETGHGGSSGVGEDGREGGGEGGPAQQDPLREALLKKSATKARKGRRTSTTPSSTSSSSGGSGKKSVRRTTRKKLGLGLEEEDYRQGGEEHEEEEDDQEEEEEDGEGRRSRLIPPWIRERRAEKSMDDQHEQQQQQQQQQEKRSKSKSKQPKQPKVKKKRSGLRALREKTFRMITGNPVGAIAFVSFRSLAVASVAGQCVTYRHPLKMMSKPAPQPEDILWGNVYMPMRLLPFKTILGVGSSFVVTLFFSVIVGIIASLTNVQTLHDHVPFMRDFLENSKLAQELLPQLPAFLLVLVDCTIPPILSFLARVVFREVRTVSEAHVTVFRRLYFFLMYNNFLILFLSSSLNTYYAIVEDPHRTLVELGIFLPNISSFYIAYIMIKVLCSHPMELSRMSSFLVAGIRWCFTDDLTEAQKATRILGCNALERPGGFYYGRIYADNLFVFTITMTFALVAPLILPFALAFFVGAAVVYKRMLLFVYEPEFESCGTFWPKTYRRMVAALYFMQLALLCVLITNEAFKEVAWLAPLPLLTLLSSLVITRSYKDAATNLPLSVAMEMDEINKTWGETYNFLNHSYIQPALQPLEKRDGVPGPAHHRKYTPPPTTAAAATAVPAAVPAPAPAAAAAGAAASAGVVEGIIRIDVAGKGTPSTERASGETKEAVEGEDGEGGGRVRVEGGNGGV